MDEKIPRQPRPFYLSCVDYSHIFHYASLGQALSRSIGKPDLIGRVRLKPLTIFSFDRGILLDYKAIEVLSCDLA